MRFAAVALLYVAVLAGGLYSAFRPVFDSRFERVQAEAGDGMLNHYLLEHTWRVVSDPGYCGTPLSPPFFYPEPLVLTYSENLLGAAPLYWGLRLFLSDELAYSVWMLVCASLTFAAFAVVARWLGCNHFLAALGGFLWAFALVHIEQGRHQQMIPRFGMPLAAYYAWHLATAPSLRSLNRMLAFAFLQAATCIYAGWFLAVGLLVFVPVAAATRPGGLRELIRFARQNHGRVIRVAGPWGLAFAAFFTPYVVVNWGHGRHYLDCVSMIPTAAGWLSGPPGSRWYESLRPIRWPVSGESVLFSGFGLYLLFLVAGLHAWRSCRGPARSPELALVFACFATVTVWGLLTLNVTGGASAWWVVRFLPGGTAIRAVSRVYVVVYLFGTLGAVVWLQAISARLRNPWLRGGVLLAIAAPVVYEQTGYELPNIARAEFYPLADRCAAGLRGAEAGYVLPTVGPDQLYGDVLGMWAGLKANVPVANGYSGRYPQHYPLIYPQHTDAALWVWFHDRFRGRVAVVDPAQPEQVRYVQIE